MIDEKKLIDRIRHDIECYEADMMKDHDLYVRVADMIHMIKGQPKINRWIPVTERLPEDGMNPIIQDSYVYPVTVDFGNVRDVRYYSFCKGHWYNSGPNPLDGIVIAWQPRPESYQPEN